MTAKVRSFGAFLVSRDGIALLRDAGYVAIGAGLVTAGIVGFRDFAPESNLIATAIQASPLVAAAAGALWVLIKA